MASTLERVQTILMDKLGLDIEDVHKDAKLRDDLGADSLDIVEIVMELEDEFDMEISDEDAERLIEDGGTVNAIINFITNHGG